jgi:antitoxin component YwqK of YwqJK toxin-antitoxin module
MLNVLFSRLADSLGIIFRIFRAFFTRQIVGVGARIKSLISVSRHAAKLLPKAVASVATVGKKPTRREDYFETKRLYIAKSLITAIILALAALGALIYFVAWPWLLSHYFTAHYFRENDAASAHSGKVVLYYDKAKDLPYFKGRLINGVIQGAGEEYGEDGLMIYSGDFADGAYGGHGKAYQAGELIYDGEFAEGIYSGQGKLFENGTLIYEGSFNGGAPNGEGSAYGADGAVLYKGGFSDGLYSGEGREYSGGRMLFKGEFADGKRNGQGAEFLENALTLEALFEDGEIQGAARIYSAGFLVYDGAVGGGIPQGFGALYSPQSGKIIFHGEFFNGRPDGERLLGMTAEDLAEAFGGTAPAAVSGDGYFAYENPAAGFTIFFPRRRDESEPRCAGVILYEPAGSDTPWTSGPWRNAGEYDTYLAGAGITAEWSENVVSDGTLYGLGAGEYIRADYAPEDGGALVTLWSREPGGDAAAISWERLGELDVSPDPAPAPTEDEKLDARVENMLEALGLLPASPDGGGEASEPNPYYGERDPEALLLNRTSDELRAALDALGDYMLGAELRAANELQMSVLESRNARFEKLAVPNESAIKALGTKMKSVELRISSAAVAMSRAEEKAGAKLGGYDVQSSLLIFDPAELDAEELWESVVNNGETGFADAKDSLLNAELAYQTLLLAQAELAAGGQTLADAREAFSIGRLGMTELEDARISVQELAISLYEALWELSRELTKLDQMTGWRLSAERGRFPKAIASIIVEEEPEAEPEPAETPDVVGGVNSNQAVG